MMRMKMKMDKKRQLKEYGDLALKHFKKLADSFGFKKIQKKFKIETSENFYGNFIIDAEAFRYDVLRSIDIRVGIQPGNPIKFDMTVSLESLEEPPVPGLSVEHFIEKYQLPFAQFGKLQSNMSYEEFLESQFAMLKALFEGPLNDHLMGRTFESHDFFERFGEQADRFFELAYSQQAEEFFPPETKTANSKKKSKARSSKVTATKRKKTKNRVK